MIKLKNSLTYLILADDDSTSRFAFELAYELEDFLFLELLQIKTYGLIYLHELDPFVKRVRLNAVSITFGNNKKSRSLKSVDFDAIVSQSQVKNLTLKLKVFGPLDIEFIMREFPKLEYMGVSGFDPDVSKEAWVLNDAQTAFTLKQFFLYLKQIPTFLRCNVSVPNECRKNFCRICKNTFKSNI